MQIRNASCEAIYVNFYKTDDTSYVAAMPIEGLSNSNAGNGVAILPGLILNRREDEYPEIKVGVRDAATQPVRPGELFKMTDVIAHVEDGQNRLGSDVELELGEIIEATNHEVEFVDLLRACRSPWIRELPT